MSAAARQLLPVARVGFAATAVSGAAMFAGGAREIAGTGAAPVKLAHRLYLTRHPVRTHLLEPRRNRETRPPPR
ncbi:hypothetical protein [Nonomuraea sp. CA-141351]|uniref:hypothetical protein n=1 Tax=Nonomuraea sp. CA-141351 TaxID=3239996 RepID=UPI003D90853B